ncbi:hypothetical protein [Sphingobium sp. TCM1]|nr:hypothetical protein [Sphingobium sp. TCM1]
MAHKFVIEKNKAGEFVAKFKYNAEVIFWTEGYSSICGRLPLARAERKI